MQSFKNVGTSLMIAGVLMLTAAGKAHAFSLNFEGIGDGDVVTNYYESSYGITFTDFTDDNGYTDGAYAEFDANNGGFFSGEPSPKTAILLRDNNPNPPAIPNYLGFTVNAPGGWQSNLIIFYYSAPYLDALTDFNLDNFMTVSIYSDMNNGGTKIDEWKLYQTPLVLDSNGDPVDSSFNVFVPVTLTIPSGSTVKSIEFYGPNDYIFIDNLSNIPTPGTGLLMCLGLAGLAIFPKRIVAAKL